MLFNYKTSAQQVLDNLFKDNLIPFKLIAHKVTDEGSHEYRIHFYDSRLHSIVINSAEPTPISKQISAVVLLRLDTRKREFQRDVVQDRPPDPTESLRAILVSPKRVKPVAISLKHQAA
jgi:hypothetical protein